MSFKIYMAAFMSLRNEFNTLLMLPKEFLKQYLLFFKNCDIMLMSDVLRIVEVICNIKEHL